MKCNDCSQELRKYYAFSEKKEAYYCMNCSHKHVNDNLVYIKFKNNQQIRLKVEVSGAGVGNQFKKCYTNYEWILRHPRCDHLQDINNLKYPIFYCFDDKLRCSDCLYDENIEIADPLMKNDYISENSDNILWQLPFTYEPHNLEFIFECDSTGFKGEEITGKIIIKNNKKHQIKDILLTVESFAAPPWDGNKPYGIYCENNYSKMIIFKEFKTDLIESNDVFEISTKFRIPNDNEINENQFLNNIYGESLNSAYNNEIHDPTISNKLLEKSLKIPDKLMIFAKFDYKTCSGYKYRSAIETKIINIK